MTRGKEFIKAQMMKEAETPKTERPRIPEYDPETLQKLVRDLEVILDFVKQVQPTYADYGQHREDADKKIEIFRLLRKAVDLPISLSRPEINDAVIKWSSAQNIQLPDLKILFYPRSQFPPRDPITLDITGYLSGLNNLIIRIRNELSTTKKKQ